MINSIFFPFCSFCRIKLKVTQIKKNILPHIHILLSETISVNFLRIFLRINNIFEFIWRAMISALKKFKKNQKRKTRSAKELNSIVKITNFLIIINFLCYTTFLLIKFIISVHIKRTLCWVVAAFDWLHFNSSSNILILYFALNLITELVYCYWRRNAQYDIDLTHNENIG